MTEGEEDGDDIDALREQTRGGDRISADSGRVQDGNKTNEADETEGTDETDEMEETEGTDEMDDTDGDDENDRNESDGREREGTRTSRQVSAKSSSPSPSDTFETVFAERARRAESGVDPRTVSATDPALSALLLSLQEVGELDAVGKAIAEEFGAPEPPEYDRDAVARLAVAYALRETAPEYFEVLAERV